MITRDELARYLHTFLACDAFNDYAPNGLQVEGRSSIQRICTAVTASAAVIDQAIAWSADALLVHHGFFWRGEDAPIVGMKRQRISSLLNNNLNLYAYHLPLDCHLTLGNNACLGRLLGISSINTHTASKTAHLLWSGELTNPIIASDFEKQLATLLERQPLRVSGTEKPISRLAWCTGGAQDFIEDAYRLGVDAYISGEISERTYYQAQELGMHYFSCGHHATERYGIQALGRHLNEKFGVEHQFVDSDNPV